MRSGEMKEEDKKGKKDWHNINEKDSAEEQEVL